MKLPTPVVDYRKLRLNNITSPEFYGMLALAWMKDKDALPGKTARYYKYLVKKN